MWNKRKRWIYIWNVPSTHKDVTLGDVERAELYRHDFSSWSSSKRSERRQISRHLVHVSLGTITDSTDISRDWKQHRTTDVFRVSTFSPQCARTVHERRSLHPLESSAVPVYRWRIVSCTDLMHIGRGPPVRHFMVADFATSISVSTCFVIVSSARAAVQRPALVTLGYSPLTGGVFFDPAIIPAVDQLALRSGDFQCSFSEHFLCRVFRLHFRFIFKWMFFFRLVSGWTSSEMVRDTHFCAEFNRRR